MPEEYIHNLVKMIEDGDISIPEIQREFVWKEQKIKDLVDSIYKQYPIGLITLYRLPKELREETGALYWVLDGQQRLLSLYLILNGYIDLPGKKRELWIWFNPTEEELRLRVTTPPRRLHDPWIKLSDFLKLDRDEFNDFIRDKSLEEKKRIERIWSRFRDYKVTYHIITRELDLDMLGDIFVRTNFAGTRVKGSDVYSTMIAVTHPGLVKRLREFANELKMQLGWDIDYGVLIRTFIAFSTNGKVKLASRVLDQADRLRKLFRSIDLEEILIKVRGSVQESIKMLRDMFRLIKRNYVYFPSENVLVTMAYYMHKRKPGENEKRGLLIWFVLASEFRRYSSAVETRLNEDLLVIEEGGDYRALISKIEIREGNLKERLKDNIIKGQISRLLLYTLLWINNAKDLCYPHNELYISDLVLHHIFPTSRLRGSEWEKLSSDVGNLTLVSGGTNRSLLNDLPENYLPRVPLYIRKAHFIPDNSELWKIRNFQQFIEERKKLLIEAVDKLY